LIFEDGNQKRDFINVKDIAAACILALEKKEADGNVFNIGSGIAYTIREIAEHFANVMNRPDLKPVITSDYRAGDIRHCFANIEKAGRLLGFTPKIDLEEGLSELTGWLSMQSANDDFEQAGRELAKRGLIISQPVMRSNNMMNA
jgi:dTDP-L-rhamnose 4-epimerase